MRIAEVPGRAASSTVAITVATAFIAFAALLSFADPPAEEGAGWRLRGTIAPAGADGEPARLPAAFKRA